MATNPFGPGKRPWTRITEVLRAASTTVRTVGELVVTDGGKVFVPDGVKADKDLVALPDAASLAATYVALRGPWVAGTSFPKNSLVIQAGAVYLAVADVPARSVFTAADWQALGGGAAAADLVLTLIGAGVAGLTGSGLTQTGAGVASANSTLLTSIGGGVARIAA